MESEQEARWVAIEILSFICDYSQQILPGLPLNQVLMACLELIQMDVELPPCLCQLFGKLGHLVVQCSIRYSFKSF